VTGAVGEVAGALAAISTTRESLAIWSSNGTRRLGSGGGRGEVGLELEEAVVDTEAVVLHAAREKYKVFLLAGEAFEDLEELGGGGVECVIELGFESLLALFPTESLFTEIGDFAVDVQVQALEMMEFGRITEHFGAKRGAHLEGRAGGLLVKLANFVSCGVGVFLDSDFDDLGGASGKNAAEGQLGGLSGGKRRNDEANYDQRDYG